MYFIWLRWIVKTKQISVQGTQPVPVVSKLTISSPLTLLFLPWPSQRVHSTSYALQSCPVFRFYAVFVHQTYSGYLKCSTASSGEQDLSLESSAGTLGILKHLGWINDTNMSSVCLTSDTQDTICILLRPCTALRTWGGRNKTHSSLFTQLEPHCMVLEARLIWGCSLQPSEQKAVTTRKFPPVQVAAKLWLAPIVGRMLPVMEGSGKIPFLLYVNFLCSFLQRLQGRK